jgi:hypothetical protein
MREIKFRAWDGNEMEYIDDWYWFEERGVHDSRGEGFGISFNIMQYTGLLDKNGKEIYEGDIYQSNGLFPCEVKFGEGRFYGEGSLESLSEDINCYGELEVIGNIYENPNLLEVS